MVRSAQADPKSTKMTGPNHDTDVALVERRIASLPDSCSVAEFVPGPGIERLSLSFDIEALLEALADRLRRSDFMGGMHDEGFGALPLTQRPRHTEWTENDLSGRYWLCGDDRFVEEACEDLVPEKAFSEFNPDFTGTYFEEVHGQLATRFLVNRMTVLSKSLYNCDSWHRDPETRLQIPIVYSPGSLFVVNHHVTHLPADGSVYFTDTRGYHKALNGGETRRVHIVAALAYAPVTS